MKFNLTLGANKEAADFLNRKALVGKNVFEKMVPEIQARLFTVGLIETMDGIQRVREMVAEVPMGADWKTTRKALADEFSPYFDDKGAAEARAELVMRTNCYDAFDAAQQRALNEQRDVMPFYMWQTVGDENVRSSHAALDGKIFPADSPFWDRKKEWGCRCFKVALSVGDVDEIRAAEQDKHPDDRQVLEGSALRNAENGQIAIGPETAARMGTDNIGKQLEWSDSLGGVGGGTGVVSLDKNARFRSTPLNDAGLAISLESLEKKYGPDTFRLFTDAARNVDLGGGKTLLDWLSAARG